MKSKLLLFVVIAVALFGTSAMAQQDPLDPGNADTVSLLLTVDTVGLTASLEVWVYNDEDMNGGTLGFSWGKYSPNDHFVMSDAVASAFIDNAFDIGPFFYEDNSLATTNANQRMLLGGVAFTPGAISADASARRLWVTYSFTLSQWDGWDADGIMIDTNMFNGGSEYLFIGLGNVNFKPIFEGIVFFGDPSLSADDPIDPLKPDSYTLSQNYPNPFNPTTEIAFDLPNKTDVKLSIFNILGQKVATLVDKNMSAGSYTVEWDASEAATGVYFYKLEADSFTETRKMMLLK